MSSWFGTSSNVKPSYTGLQLQTSVNTLPIPIVYGRSKVAANIIWYANFQTEAVQSSGGKGGSFTATTGYNYSADLILALCEGPINGIAKIWRDQSIYAPHDLGLTLFNGATPQPVWGYLAANYPNQALAYQGTAYVCAASYQLGSAADVGNHNFEIVGILAGSADNLLDCDPTQVIYDFLTNPQYGASFDPAKIDTNTLYGAPGDSSLQSYCRAMGIAISPCINSQEQASAILNRWLQILNCAAVWSGGKLKFIPYGDQTINAGNVTQTLQYAVPQITTPTDGSTPPPPQVPITGFVSDGGVVYAYTGAALSPTGTIPPTATGTYAISGNTYLFAPGDEGKVVLITTTKSIPAGYTPNLTPIFALDDRDYIDVGGEQDPIQCSRVDPFSLPTILRVECLSRSNQYGATPVEARDQSQIELYGPRVGATIQAHEICDEVVIGPIVAQTILQRLLYVRAHFTFKLSWEYCVLDPMDIVQITDVGLGLANFPVRITTIEEDEKGILTVTAEELVLGVSSPVLYPNNGPQGYQPNQAAPPGPVNTPLIYEPPTSLTNGMPEVWVGASGGSGGVNNPMWGGANVWVSLDGTTFTQVATIGAPLRQGFLTQPLPIAAGWDATHTLSVDLTESNGVLTGTSQASAQQGGTLSIVDGELLAYQNALLTNPDKYDLSGLQRALYGTPPAAHSAGAPFARLDSAVVQYALPANLIGQTLYFKFQSFNIFGGTLQDLSTCVVYTYTPAGTGSGHPIAMQLLTGMPLDLGALGAAPTVFDDFTTAPTGSVDLGGTP